MGRDKATLVFPASADDNTAGRGTTMVEHVVDVVGQRCRPVFVVAAPGQPLPELRAEVLRDKVPGLGPLSATGQGLRAARAAGAARALVCAVDMPLLTVDVIEVLADRAAEVDADVVLPWDGRDHYLAAVYRTDLADRIEALVAAGKRSMSALVDSVDTQRVVLSDSRPLTNVNSAADLRALAWSGH
jgi:molybdopterin-guanine dinucleotide biosynthesis protein A